ncbi:uncharacterized protein LOC110018644 isoform X3 [Phalaenopsis equestris]|uniref:uncharacterized protein LOC110018644 isoform X3 n=1 Tax=Phalaenopsis equestris TaxID=78828 RepID=UPI0009E41FEA|nr:uncharacterized protein LOC110018644 isoform X3 [Phalaenopsis equestris]
MRNITPSLLLVFCIILGLVSGMFSSKSVILSSIEIFKTHEWLSPQPVIYFHCQGENKIILPDVKEKNFVYKFKGIESWQPIAGFPDKKCKRCGLYELDRLKSDDVFDEWELCPDEFLEGNYVHYKQKEFNATFACTECMTRVAFGIYKYWQKRKREQNQARFLKLFDEGDDIDNELDL